MGKRAKDSSGAVPKAKGAKKSGPSDLPQIPPDAVKLPHMVKFNEWAQLSYTVLLIQ